MAWLFRLSVFVAVAAAAIWFYFKSKASVPNTVYGSVNANFEAVREKFRDLLKDGWIKGAQFAVYYEDELVVDLAGGYADEEVRRPLKTDILLLTWSSIKSVFSLLTTVAIEKAGIDFEERVANYWPEFGQTGKENVTIANLFLHQGGVCGLDGKFSLQDSEVNSELYQKVLAEQRPLTPINERPYYHSWTYGLYLDQLSRRVDADQRGARQILREELGEKCGELDVKLGLPLAEYYRLARLYPAGLDRVLDNDGIFGVLLLISMWLKLQWKPKINFPNGTTVELDGSLMNGFVSDFTGFDRMLDPETLSTFVLSAGGSMTTARDLARVYNIVANGGYCTASRTDGSSDRVRLLSRETVDKITTKRYSGPSGFLPMNEERALFGWIFQSPANTSMIGSPGFGGQNSFADPETGVSLAYLTNYLKPVVFKDYAYSQLLDVTYRVIADLRSNEDKALNSQVN